MKPAPFKYTAPTTLASAIQVMNKHGDNAKLLAGGQSLIPAMNFRLVQPTMLVDLNEVPELGYVRKGSGNQLKIGAMTRQAALGKSLEIRETAPLLYETIPFIAHAQIRNRGTIGGNLAHADPASELPVIAVTLDMSFTIQSVRGSRNVRAVDFFQGVFTTALEPDEILTEIVVPPLREKTGWYFTEFARRKGDYALLGVTALITLDDSQVCQDAKLVYLNAAEIPLVASQASRMLVGQKATKKLFEEVARFVSQEAFSPVETIHATAPYLRHLAGVLTTRALESAWSRAESRL